MVRPAERAAWFHGTSLSAAVSLLKGAELRLDVALAQKIDGPPGFYLSDDLDTALFFAGRRIPGAVVRYALAGPARTALLAGGARMMPIPQGVFPTKFPGQQFMMPPVAFTAFNRLRQAGSIVIAPHVFA